MLRLPTFTYHRPGSAAEAVRLKSEYGAQAMYVAGGTDLYPNMKRRQQTPAHVIALGSIPDLDRVEVHPQGGVRIGALARLSMLERHPHLLAHFPALAHAVAEVSTPLLRNMGTLGGNLLLDTRCTYYDQTYEWRESIHFCMKKDGDICWVAPGSPRCWAVQSSDTVPLLCAMEADVELVGPAGTRRLRLSDLYRDDGMRYLTKAPDELLTRVFLPPPANWKASYLKLRRRGTFDFPVLGVGACLWFEGGKVTKANVRLGGAGSFAIPATETEKLLVGRELTDAVIATAAAAAMKPARTMDNTDLDVYWRRKMAPIYVARALQGCR